MFMTKKKQALIITLLVFVLALVILLVDGLFFANKRVKTRQITIQDTKISESLDGLKIVYFSDVHYNLFVDENRLDKAVKQINKEKPDVVLFGGDLVDYTEEGQLEQQQLSYLIDTLSSINAPYGKFAVSGQQEDSSEYATNTFESLMSMAEFEIIDDKLFHIYYNKDFFNLIGTKSEPNVNLMDNSKYTIAFTHEPKNADLFAAFPIDLMIAGSTHGGQINLPLFRGLFNNAQPYTRHTQNLSNMQLDISSGIGTSKVDIRLFADGDILVYTLKSLQK